MATLIKKMAITSLCVAATMFTACAKPSNSVRGTRAASDPNLHNVSELPEAPAPEGQPPVPAATAAPATVPPGAATPITAMEERATLNVVQTGSAFDQMSDLMIEATKVIGVKLDLEVDPRGQGTPSFFDPSVATRGTHVDEQLLTNELSQIRQLLTEVAGSREIRTLMTELKIDAIQILNPYNSKERIGVVSQNGQTTLLLEMTLSAPQIVDVLKNTKDF